MSLQHELRMASARVPELDTTVLGAREHPFRVRSEGDGEDEVLDLELATRFMTGRGLTTYPVAFQSPDATPAFEWRPLVIRDRPRGVQLPHLDSFVQAAANEFAVVWGESNAINTLRMTLKII